MTPERPRVLVTAVGGDLAQGVVKALRLARRPFEVHGCDARESGVGRAFVETFHVVPRAEAGAAYVDALAALAAKLGLDAVIPAGEPEIEALSRLGAPPALPGGVPVVCADARYVGTFGDKLACYRALDGKVSLAPYADGSDAGALRALAAAAGFPLVVKSRRSCGSRSLHVVEDERGLARAIRETPLPVVQGFIDEAGGEYSVGVFAGGGARTAIAFKRRLGRTGSSWSAETDPDPDVLAYALEIARATGLSGSANVQARKSSRGVRLLEINTRFSSLVAARACAGFHDVEWAVDLALGRAPVLPQGGYKRIRFQRFVHEMVDAGAGFDTVPQWAPRSPNRPVVAAR